MLAVRVRDCGSPGMELRLGSDEAPGRELSPGMELADGRLGSDGVVGADGRLGSDGVDGRLGVEGAPGTDGKLGSDGVVGADGRLGSDGRLGTDVGTDGGVTQTVTPLALDALTEPDPAGEVTLPPPDALAGLGIEGVAGVLTHCWPAGRECGIGSEERLGTDVGATAFSAPLGKAFAATAATAAAPAVSRIIRPKRGMFPLLCGRPIGRRWNRVGETARSHQSCGRFMP
jgi:hypothetical protein